MLTYFAFLIVAASLWASGTRMIGVFVVASLFGGSAAASLPGLGGAPLTPAVFSLPFLAYHAIRTAGPQRIYDEIRSGAGLFLVLLVCWGVFSAIVMPQYFAGQMMVNTTDRNSFESAVTRIYLRPNSTNFTQSCYLVGSAAAFLFIRALLGSSQGFAVLRRSVLLLAGLNVFAASINILERTVGFPSVLEYVRNAQYAIIDGDVVGGLIRITGTFSEASAFSAFTLALFAFTWSLARSGVDRPLAGVLAALSFVLLLFSTSSTAYAALAIYLACIFSGWVARSLWHQRVQRISWTVVIIWSGLTVACIVILVSPALVAALDEFVQLTLFRKLESSSGIERSLWNLEAWGNFIDTFGLGTGLGSSRASSFPLVLLSNVGVIGTVLFGGFLYKALMPSIASNTDSVSSVTRASAHAVFIGLIAASTSQTVFDLGMAFYVFAAAATGPVRPSAVRQAPAGREIDAHA